MATQTHNHMNQTIIQRRVSIDLTRRVIELHGKGYELDFSVTADHRIRCNQDDRVFTVDQVLISLIDQRFDHANNGYQYIHAVETCCGDKGILVDCCPCVNAFLSRKFGITAGMSVMPDTISSRLRTA